MVLPTLIHYILHVARKKRLFYLNLLCSQNHVYHCRQLVLRSLFVLRVVAGLGVLLMDSLSCSDSFSGSVCYTGGPPSSNIRVSSSRPLCFCDWCLSDRLESVCIKLCFPNVFVFEQPSVILRDCFVGNPLLARSVLVSIVTS